MNRSLLVSTHLFVRSLRSALMVLLVLGASGSVTLASAATKPTRIQLGGELDSLRKDTHEKKGSGEGEGSTKTKGTGQGEGSGGKSESVDLSSDSEAAPFAVLILEITFIIVASPFFIPIAALSDAPPRPGYFASAPYSDVPGYLQSEFDPLRDPSAMGRPLVGAVVVEWIRPAGHLDRLGAWARLEGSHRWGIDLAGSLVREQASTGPDDQLGLVAGDLTYRFAQGPRLQFRVGLGVNGLIDHGWSATGLDALYAVDIMPSSPWVVALAVRGGRLGSAGVFTPRATVGFTTHGWQLEAGYSGLKVGSVDLGGPVLGVRRWF